MYTIMEESTGNVLGLAVTGKLTEDDYQSLDKQMADVVDQYGSIRMLFLLSDFKGWTLKSMLSDLRMDVKYHKTLERAAVVGDRAIEEWGTKLSSPFIHGELKWFERSEIADAWEWVKAGAKTGG